MYLNRAIIIGHLTKDPDLRSLPSGMSIASFTVATNRVWKDKTGAKQEVSDFHSIVVMGKQAQACHQMLRRSSQVLVEGRLQTRSWEHPGGHKVYRTEIISEKIHFGPRPLRTKAQMKTDAEFEEGLELPTDDLPTIQTEELSD